MFVSLVFFLRDMHCVTRIFRRVQQKWSCVITVTVDTFVASLFERVTCMSSSALVVVGPVQALADSLHEHRNEILRLDCRTYPSTSMKSGISTKELVKNHVAIRAIMEGQIAALKKRLLQTELEAACDKLNSRTGDALTQLCRRWTLNYAQWRKDVSFSIRIMASHTWLKYGTYAKSIAAGSVISPTVHPPEMVALYSLCELLLLRAQDAVVDESVELTPTSVPRGAASAIAATGRDLPESQDPAE